ncbi:cinnamoyl-CoA reductase 1-like [Cucurbita pepo subsp. pepo]|uniref:cinnamoyl-CoA reductase 1-like n=1 Tax=Cucurbita pepo subsp. pepo TaxID=3664 RepID=UPI000C9D9134|nr:cinnamoyl-CoA reductase 1-like [Cucurbita pepo subsp. pepo]
MATVARKGKVCVTGAGGFIGSWVVKLLLSRDYIVHGTVREPGDAKYDHLRKLEKGTENLKLFKADLLDYESLHSAIAGCDGVFHVASPVPHTTSSNPETEVIEPAVKGTRNVLEACVDAKVKRVVVVSSVAAVFFNPSWPQGRVIDESCWSDKEYCKATKNWYFLAKTEAESEALEFGRRRGLDVVTICPTLVIGPILQPTVNASSMVLLRILKEGLETLENRPRMLVDVRDVAEALVLLYEKGEAEGRYICTSHTMETRELVDALKKKYPDYSYPKTLSEGNEKAVSLSSEKLQGLGWKCRALEETLADAVKSFKDAGMLE